MTDKRGSSTIRFKGARIALTVWCVLCAAFVCVMLVRENGVLFDRATILGVAVVLTFFSIFVVSAWRGFR